MLSAITRLFPLWALLLSVLAYYTPTTFTGIGPWVTTLLMLIMLGMGVHLKIDDFKRVLSRPAPVAAGIFLHYLVMPLAAWLLAMAFKMPPDLSAGMVLVGSVASGTASNVMIFLAKGDVALSVTISSVSTLVGVIATPLLTRLYVDAHIQVDVMGMLLSILQIVVIPIALGLVIHHLFPRVVKAVEPYLPAFSMVCILAIISAVVAGGKPWRALEVDIIAEMETVGCAVIQHFPALSKLWHQAVSIRINIKQTIVELCGQRIDNQAATRFLRVKGINLPADAIDKSAIANIRERRSLRRSNSQVAEQTECQQGR